jgi:uncharacterized protein (DUF3820 family)
MALETPFTDKTLMPFGKYKGKALINIPAYYFIWLWENTDVKGALHTYIKENLDVFKQEIKNSNKHLAR